MFEQYYTERIGVESNGEFVSNGDFIMHSNIQLSGVLVDILSIRVQEAVASSQ